MPAKKKGSLPWLYLTDSRPAERKPKPAVPSGPGFRKPSGPPQSGGPRQGQARGDHRPFNASSRHRGGK
jgi:hypothetical protein